MLFSAVAPTIPAIPILVNYLNQLFSVDNSSALLLSLHHLMRAKVERSKQHKARGVSLSPQMNREAMKRAQELDVSFSKYVQRLIRVDLAKNLLGDGV